MMTWEDLVIKAKCLGYDLSGNDLSKWLVNCEIVFYKDGSITADYGGTLAENRTYEQMYQIMLNLED